LISAITNAVNTYLAPSTPGRTTGNESVVRAPDRSNSRPSSVSRGSTAGTGTARAITRGPSTAPVARGGQSVKKVTAKGKQGGGSGRTVRF
jgi:hypothetical protein